MCVGMRVCSGQRLYCSPSGTRDVFTRVQIDYSLSYYVLNALRLFQSQRAFLNQNGEIPFLQFIILFL